jgi:iron complex outermembrane recepter protein
MKIQSKIHLHPWLQSPPSRTTVSHRALRRTLPALAASLFMTGGWAAAPQDASWLSLEELMTIEVSSASKRPQRLADAATAIYAIGREEIRRSGATNLPELLRTVPGVQVSRIDGSRYAVSIRGGSSRYAGKLLVLLDGRTLYTPVFSGTYWEAQDVLLEDVERVEVIRGSGGTLWGANAVNGVINIITRQAVETQGDYLEAKAGTLENGLAVRHGGELGEDGHFRIYGKLDKHDPLETSTGQAAHDAWRQKRAGFRTDLKLNANDTVTVQGDVYETRAQQSVLLMSQTTRTASFVPDTAKLSGANLLARWQRAHGKGEGWHLQAYADHAEVDDAMARQKVDTVDVEWQSQMRLTPSQDLTWGLGLRNVQTEVNGGYTVSMVPNRINLALYSGFVQDEIRLGEDLHLTLGTKLEHNDFTGFEVQPSARLQWRATPTDNFWVAASRSVQTPFVAATATDAHVGTQAVPMLGNVVVGVRGNPKLKSEVMISREIGYRGQFGPDVNVDVAAFYNTYDDLVSRERGSISYSPYPYMPMNFANLMEGRAYGFEMAGNWQVAPTWRLHGSYSWLKMDLRAKPGGQGVIGFGAAGSSPEHMVQMHSLHNLGRNLELDAALYFNGSLSFETSRGTVNVEKYTRFDLRLGWRPSPNVEVNLIGRNLLQKRHLEYVADDVTASQVPRSVMAQVKLKF